MKKCIIILVTLLSIAILNAQNVGINTNSPQATLHVHTPSSNDGLKVDINGATKFQVDNNGGVSIGTNSTPPANGLTIEGRLGVGTNSPQAQMEVRGDSDFYGYIAGGNNSGQLRYYSLIDVNDVGAYLTYGSNNNINVLMSYLTNFPNNGLVEVRNSSGTNQAGMYVNTIGQGVVYGDIKNFRMEHPTQPGKEIWYASVEGPEAAAYERGTATLVKGEVSVEFSEHFQMVANHETMTVIVTPRSPDSKGLAAFEYTETGFKVKELFQGTGNYAFDWEVKCVRKGYEDYRVIRDASESAAGGEFERR